MLSIGADTEEDLPTNDRVAPFQDAGEVGSEVAGFRAAIHGSDHCQVFLR
jgi:hypothetical protein